MTEYPMQIVNLTKDDIVICDNRGQLIVTLRSVGELALIETKGPRFVHHHIHHFDPVSNDEAGVPILEVQGRVSLDPQSSGYSAFKSLSERNCVVVSPNVAQVLLTNRVPCNASYIFTIGEHTMVSDSEGITRKHMGLKWHPK